MRTFEQVRSELALQYLTAAPLGTLYYAPIPPAWPKILVRHFDRGLAPSLANMFAELIAEVAAWVSNQRELNSLVDVQRMSEVGMDFVSRPYHMYGTSIEAYRRRDNPVEPPSQLNDMLRALNAIAGKRGSARGELLRRIIERSLLTAGEKTYFNEDTGRFIIVEPQLTRMDVDDWVRMQ